METQIEKPQSPKIPVIEQDGHRYLLAMGLTLIPLPDGKDFKQVSLSGIPIHYVVGDGETARMQSAAIQPILLDGKDLVDAMQQSTDKFKAMLPKYMENMHPPVPAVDDDLADEELGERECGHDETCESCQ